LHMKKPSYSRGLKILYEVQNKGKHNKDEGKPLGSLSQFCIKSLALALAKESICAAGDGTGETGALAALHKNDDHDGQTGENLKNSKDDGESRHVFQSFRFYTNSQLIEYNIRKKTIQVLSYDIMKMLNNIIKQPLKLWASFCRE